MEPRLKYGQLAPDGIAKMTALEHYLNTATNLEPILLELVRLRASQMNGCEYCIKLHTAELKKHNESPARIDSIADWGNSDVYTHRERASLASPSLLHRRRAARRLGVPHVQGRQADRHAQHRRVDPRLDRARAPRRGRSRARPRI